MPGYLCTRDSLPHTQTLQPMPHSSTAAMRAVSAGTARGGTLLHTGSHGTCSGGGRGNGIVQGLADVAGAPGAANQAPLRGAGPGCGGTPPAARLPHTQPAGSTRPGAEHSALGGENPPPPLGPAGAPVGGRGAPSTGREPKWFGAHGTGRAVEPPPHSPPSTPLGAACPRWQRRPKRRRRGTRALPCAMFFPRFLTCWSSHGRRRRPAPPPLPVPHGRRGGGMDR